MTIKKDRKNFNTTIDKDLYKKVKILALELDKNANDLIEEGLIHVLKKYEKPLPVWAEEESYQK